MAAQSCGTAEFWIFSPCVSTEIDPTVCHPFRNYVKPNSTKLRKCKRAKSANSTKCGNIVKSVKCAKSFKWTKCVEMSSHELKRHLHPRILDLRCWHLCLGITIAINLDPRMQRLNFEAQIWHWWILFLLKLNILEQCIAAASSFNFTFKLFIFLNQNMDLKFVNV